MRGDDAGYDPSTETFRETFDWAEPGALAAALTKTVSVIEDKPPSDLPSLHDHLDVNALTSLFEPVSDEAPRPDGRVEFTFLGHRVTVHAAGELVVEATDIPDRGANNLLVFAPERARSAAEACFDGLRAADPGAEDVLSIVFDRYARDEIADWRDDYGPLPAKATIVDVGECTRSPVGTSVESGGGLTIEAVPDGSDLARLGRIVTTQLAAWREDGNRTVVCFHSIDALLDHVGPRQAFAFLHLLTGQIRAEGALGHFHFDPRAVDEETGYLIERVFDTVVDRT